MGHHFLQKASRIGCVLGLGSLGAAGADQALTLKYMHLVNIGSKNFSIPLGTIVIKDY